MDQRIFSWWTRVLPLGFLGGVKDANGTLSSQMAQVNLEKIPEGESEKSRTPVKQKEEGRAWNQLDLCQATIITYNLRWNLY